MFDPEIPYNDLPLLPPAIELETKEVLKLCIKARSALSELKQIGRLIPNQSVLINTIPLLEAKSSSEIENIVTTQDELFEYANSDIYKANPAAKETLFYRKALYEGYNNIKSRPLCVSTAINIMQTIRQTDEEIRKIPGTALKNLNTGKIIYTPPCGKDVIMDKLKNLEIFINTANDIDPLIVMSAMHYQFEAIHPFSDGNGRTGRILNILYLIQKKLLDIPVLYLSKYINENRVQYYSNLINVTLNHNWSEWITYMINGIYETSLWTINKIASIKDLIQETKTEIQTTLPKIYSMELLEILFTQPYCRISNLNDAGIAKRQTASIYLKELSRIGILEEKSTGKEKFFINKKFYNLLSQN